MWLLGSGRDFVKPMTGTHLESMDTADATLPEGAGRSAEPTDHELVTAVRRGDDRAFEQLYARYHRRIAAYVRGMVKDHGRAEDVTQEVFVSALRRMRETERPIGFKPWIYEIAKNACIDAHRRRRRTEEVSFDADDRLSPADQVRLVATGPEPDQAVGVKQDVDHLFGAFGEVSDSQYEILVLREFEGLSYEEIGTRMGMSRPAVESALFRARKRLGEEYDELASGARCTRVQGMIADGGELRGRGDRRRLARHVSHCQPCRRAAARAGLDLPRPVRRRVAERLAGLLPLPVLLRFRRGAEDGATASSAGGGGGWMTHLPTLAESMSTGWGKAAVALAAVALAGGVGVSTIPDQEAEGDAGRRAPEVRVAGATGGGTVPSDRAAAAEVKREQSAPQRRQKRRAARGEGDGKAGSGRSGNAAAAGGGQAGAGGAQSSAPAQTGTGGGSSNLPAVDVPGGSGVRDKVDETVDKVRGAVPDVNETVTPKVQAPAVDVPDAPAVPSVPSVPSVPNVPSVPSLPSAPVPPVNAPNPAPVLPELPGTGGVLP